MNTAAKTDLLLAPERFKGLNQSQIAALLRADEMAGVFVSLGSEHTIDLQTIRLHLEEQGLVFGLSDMLRYADHFEAQDKPGVAEFWLKIAAESRGTSELLKAFYVRRGWVASALQAFKENLDFRDIREMAEHQFALAREDKGNFSRHFEYALEAWKAIQDKTGMEALVRLAIEHGQMERAEVAAGAAGRVLDLGERRLAIKAMMARPLSLSDAAKWLEKYPFKDLRTMYVRLLVRDKFQFFSGVQGVATKLDMRLRVRDIEVMLAGSLKEDHRFREWVLMADELAKRSRVWVRKRLDVYRAARDAALSFGAAKDAAEFARVCETPLTAGELKNIVERYRRDDRDSMRQQAQFAAAELIKVLYAEANPPPF